MVDIFLRQGEVNPSDIKLRDPTIPDVGGSLTIDFAGNGIVTAFISGLLIVALTLFGAGIGTSEIAGSPALTLDITSTGIVSGKIVGSPLITLTVIETGIFSGEAIGTPNVVLVGDEITIEVLGIETEENFGNPTIALVYYGVLKRWNGSIWVKESLRVYLEGSWQSKTLKRWSGSEWKLVDTIGT